MVHSCLRQLVKVRRLTAVTKNVICLEFPSEVPYVFMRGACALCGALLIPTVYEVCTSNFSLIEFVLIDNDSVRIYTQSSSFSLFLYIDRYFNSKISLLIVFACIDNSLQIQSRVIMLDAFVVLFTYLSLMCYLKVYRCRAQ